MLELVKEKPESVDVDEIIALVEDILRYFDDKEDEEYETNQYFIGMKNLFRGCVIKSWTGVNFSGNKYRKLNKIVAKHCAEYYDKCWK